MSSVAAFISHIIDTHAVGSVVLLVPIALDAVIAGAVVAASDIATVTRIVCVPYAAHH